MKQNNSTRRSFTLLELLFVIALATFIMVIALPNIQMFLRSNDLSNAGRIVEQAFTNARMLATTRGRRVEARLIRFDTTNQVRGIQLFIFDESGVKATPASAFRPLPQTVTVNLHTQNSTLWAELPDKNFSTDDPKVNVPEAGTAYTARAILFLPNGGLALNPDKNWFLTLQNNNADWTISTLPANFYCIQIDPVLGTLRTYRP